MSQKSWYQNYGTLAAACTLCAGSLWAQSEDMDLNALSLDELMNIKVDVSSNTEKTIREQPGIVSVVTADEIRRQGARDLLEILQYVPGFQFGTDLGGAVGPAFRGLWAYEGKTQIIVDGIEMNEGLFGTVILNRSLSADLIRQVDIIRGPGSALYGGTAELSVIRITTKGAEMNGGFGLATLSATDEGISQQYSFAAGYTLAQDWRIHVSGSYRDDYLSNEPYVDLDGDSYSLADESSLTPWNTTVGVGWKGLQTQFTYDYYDIESRHSVGNVASPRAYEFETYSGLVKYDFEISDWIKITPKIIYREQEPWRQIRTGGVRTISTNRLTGNLTANFAFSEAHNLMTGVEYYRDEGKCEELQPGEDVNTYFNGDSRTVSYKDYALFAQYEWTNPIVNVTVGGRYEDHDALEDGSFVPRVGLTQVWDKFHAKALYSQAFRTPNIRVVNEAYPVGATLEAEQTDSYEVELGYQFSPNWALVGNVFYLQVENPYLYFDAVGGYVHEGEVSTYGFETELRHSDEWGRVTVGYSLYIPEENTVPLFAASDDDTLLGIANHKLTALVGINLVKDLSWNIGAIYLSPIDAAVPGAVDPNTFFYPVAEYDDSIVFNTYIEYLIAGFSVGVGVNDILDEGRMFYQPYNGGSPALPDKSREFFVKVGYKF